MLCLSPRHSVLNQNWERTKALTRDVSWSGLHVIIPCRHVVCCDGDKSTIYIVSHTIAFFTPVLNAFIFHITRLLYFGGGNVFTLDVFWCQFYSPSKQLLFIFPGNLFFQVSKCLGWSKRRKKGQFRFAFAQRKCLSSCPRSTLSFVVPDWPASERNRKSAQVFFCPAKTFLSACVCVYLHFSKFLFLKNKVLPFSWFLLFCTLSNILKTNTL